MLRILVLPLLLILGVAAPATAESTERPDLRFLQFKSWALVYAETGPRGELIEEYTPVGQVLENWQEMFTWQYFPGWMESPRSIMERMKAVRMTLNPETDWKIIRQEKDSVTYELQIRDAPDLGDRLLITRILAGEEGTHIFHYESKRLNISLSYKSGWITALRRIELID